MTGNLFVIAAPSGAGKTSLVKILSETVDNLRISVSHTTRSQRPMEINGEDYFFVSHEVFLNMIKNNAFLEYAVVFNHYYGTSNEWVMQQLSQGIDVVLEIDWQGARQVHDLFPEAIRIFILPPSVEALKSRLQNRQQDNLKTITERMEAAEAEMSHFKEFDYLVVNDQFDIALQDLLHIVMSSRLKTSVQVIKQSPLLDNLFNKQ